MREAVGCIVYAFVAGFVLSAAWLAFQAGWILAMGIAGHL